MWRLSGCSDVDPEQSPADATGAELERHDYTAFGEELTSPTGLDTRRFGGKERDPEAGLAYFAARYYAPETGRFAQADDPGFGNVFDPQSLNQYGYTSGNPLRWVDPSGHQRIVFRSQATVDLWELFQSELAELRETYDAWIAENELKERAFEEKYGKIEVMQFGMGGGLSSASSLLRPGSIVIGKFPAYLKVAKQLGAKRFNIPASFWEKMSGPAR